MISNYLNIFDIFVRLVDDISGDYEQNSWLFIHHKPSDNSRNSQNCNSKNNCHLN